MYGIYEGIIEATEKVLEDYGQTKELLEYPEVQADKAYYLSVLTKFNRLSSLLDRLTELKKALDDERELTNLLSESSSSEERDAVYEEISALKRTASRLSASLSNSLGLNHTVERAYLRFKMTAYSSKFGVQLYSQIKEYLLSFGVKMESDKGELHRQGYISELSFIAEGEDVITKLLPLTGAHKVFIAGARSEELCFAVSPADRIEEIAESDLDVEVYHSSGAGGQNVNKVETAVRVTHIPTGIVVTCQDERSQLSNKKRAVETIKKRLRDRAEQSEKKRMDADVYAQFNKKNTPISFDFANSTMTDTRVKAFTAVPFPLADFSAYINSLISL